MRKIAAIIFILICYHFLLCPAEGLAADARHSRVLVIHSYHPGYLWTDGINSGIQQELGKDAEIEVEYMDAKRLTDDKYLSLLSELFAYKFSQFHYDLIITSDDDAFQFVLKQRGRIVPDVPVVFCGVNDFTDAMLQNQRQVTGIVEDMDVAGTIDLARNFQPHARQIAVITDRTRTGIICRRAVENTLSAYPELTPLYLDGLSVPRMLETVQSFSDDTIVLYLPLTRDANGNMYNPEEVVALVSQHSQVPVYTLWDHYLGQGVVGGHLTQSVSQGQAAAAVARRILNGEDAGTIPVIKQSPKEYIFDNDQLDRFHIKKSSLPAESAYINEPHTFYYRYKGLVWGISGLIIALIIIILLLGANAIIRRQALTARNQLAMIVESSDDAIVSLNLDGTIQSWNEGAKKIYGYSAAETIGQNIKMLVPPDSQQEIADIIKFVRKGKIVKQYGSTRIRKDGRFIDTSRTVSPIRDGAGQIVGAAVIARDITELQQAMEEVHRLNSELERRVLERTAELAAANHELEAFSYSVSHDLRAPLRSIDGFSQALLEDYTDRLDETGRDYLNRVRAASQRMGALIDDLLKLSRVTRTEMTRTTVNLSSLARSIIDELKKAEPGRAVTLRISPSLTVIGDEHFLRIALDNLINNAWKFTRKQPNAMIEFGLSSIDGNNTRQTFYIRDNGAGFDMQYAGKLFGAFQRLHKSEDFSGTGIGLAIVQRIIHRHGGRVWAEGQVGRGATFYFTL